MSALHNSSKETFLAPFLNMETGSERHSDLPKATSQVQGRTGIQTQVCLIPDLTILSWSSAHGAK